MISLHRRRFLFGAVPALVVARTYFVMPRWAPAPFARRRGELAWGDSWTEAELQGHPWLAGRPVTDYSAIEVRYRQWLGLSPDEPINREPLTGNVKMAMVLDQHIPALA